MVKKLLVFIQLTFTFLIASDPSNNSLLKMGSSKVLKGIEYKLIEAKRTDNNILLKIEVKNINRKNFNYSALLFHKLYDAKGNQIANIEPFLSKKSVVFDVKRGQSFISNLVYEIIEIDQPLQLSAVTGANPLFKTNGLILTCKSSLDNEQIYFELTNIF
mgnify:FL=1